MEQVLALPAYYCVPLKGLEEKQSNLQFLRNCFSEYRSLDRSTESSLQETVVYLNRI